MCFPNCNNLGLRYLIIKAEAHVELVAEPGIRYSVAPRDNEVDKTGCHH